MPKVTFAKAWRGHAAGDEAELTAERAAELERLGYLKGAKKPATKRTTKKTTTDSEQ